VSNSVGITSTVVPLEAVVELWVVWLVVSVAVIALVEEFPVLTLQAAVKSNTSRVRVVKICFFILFSHLNE